jgi:hypothetical protein
LPVDRRECKEVWRVDNHQEPENGVTDQIYTTAYASTVPRPEADVKEKPDKLDATPRRQSDP